MRRDDLREISVFTTVDRDIAIVRPNKSPPIHIYGRRGNTTSFVVAQTTIQLKATPNWTLVSRLPFLENMMRAGGVFVLLYYCEYD